MEHGTPHQHLGVSVFTVRLQLTGSVSCCPLVGPLPARKAPTHLSGSSLGDKGIARLFLLSISFGWSASVPT